MMRRPWKSRPGPLIMRVRVPELAPSKSTSLPHVLRTWRRTKTTRFAAHPALCPQASKERSRNDKLFSSRHTLVFNIWLGVCDRPELVYFWGPEAPAAQTPQSLLTPPCPTRIGIKFSCSLDGYSLESTPCYAIMFPGRKSCFRAGFRPDSNKENFKIGPPAGQLPAEGPT